MKVVIAIDSFKGSLTSPEAGNHAKEGIQRVYPDAEICVRPMADGGEGTMETLAMSMDGQIITAEVTGPLGEPVACDYAILPGGTAVMEMAGAAGLTLVPPEKRNPLYTTTYGLGELILHAAEQGCRNFIIGIGGSSTNDGGAGMLQALGARFLDKQGNEISRGAIGLKSLYEIKTERMAAVLKECSFRIACDVDNPLCGERGCSAVYGPQKGADPEMIRQMDGWLETYARIAGKCSSGADADRPGAGAAGGLGFAFQTFLNGDLRPGAELVLEQTGLEEYVKDADIVITGEGRLDSQTVMGKAPTGVVNLASRYGKPVIAFSGCVAPDASVCNQKGIAAYFPILRTPVSLEEAMDPINAGRNMADTAEQVFRLIQRIGM